MLFLDALIRFSTFGLLLGLFILTLRDERKTLSAYLLCALCISLMALMVSSTPNSLGMPDNVRWVSRLIDIPSTVLIWLFVKSVMRDKFRLDLTHIVLAGIFCAGYVIMWLYYYLRLNIGESWLSNTVNLYALALFSHLTFQTLNDWRNDLVEERRRSRFAFLLLILAVVSLLILSKIFLFERLGREVLLALENGATFLLVLAGYVWLLQTRHDHIAFSHVSRPTSGTKLSEQETKIQSALLNEMLEKRAWAEPRLTIKALAKRIGIGEHKLRKFINGRLGFRNFSQYLHGYRLETARMMLSDPLLRDSSILTIALDCGFNSSSTFNRIFKDSEGMSPKEYRKRRLTDQTY